jgi:hypothetical protein
MGMRLWPPLRILASSPYCCRNAIASGRVFGLRYSKAGGIIVDYLPLQISRRWRKHTKKGRRAGAHRPGNVIVLSS